MKKRIRDWDDWGNLAVIILRLAVQIPWAIIGGYILIEIIKAIA